MKYRVTGADRQTGEDIELTFDAPTETAALDKANQRGVLISTCVSVGVNGSADDDSADERFSSKQVKAITALVVVGVAVVGVLIYVLFLRDQWDNQNWDRLAQLKSDADALVAQHHPEEAKTKYEELFRIVGDHTIHQQRLTDLLNEARASQKDVVAAIVLLEQQKYQEAERRRIEEQRAADDARRKQETAEATARAEQLRREKEQAQLAEQQAKEQAKKLEEQRRIEQAQRSTDEVTNQLKQNPAKSFTQFTSNLFAVLPKTKTPPFYNQFMHRQQQNSHSAIDGTAKIDVQQTNSLVSPYIGTLEVGLMNFANGEHVDEAMCRFNFAAQDGKWVFQRLERYVPATQEWLEEKRPAEIELWNTVTHSAQAPK